MKIVQQLLLVAVAWWLRQGGAPAVAGQCARRCGSVRIFYPFGLEPQCVRSNEFLLNCSTTEGSGGQLLLGNYSIHKISVSDSTMVVRLPELHDCYPLVDGRDVPFIDLSSYPQYRLSVTRNTLKVLGCGAYVSMNENNTLFLNGCTSYCSGYVDLAKETTCLGLGCCQASIPKGLTTLHMKIYSYRRNASVAELYPCIVAFVGDKELFNISSRSLPTLNDLGKTADLVLDWMIGWDVTCAQAKLNQLRYACGDNTECRNFTDGPGYRCFCKPGYEGNPYDRSRGCQDINECEDPQKYPCPGKCENQPGNYTCNSDDNSDNNNNLRNFALATIFATGVGTYASASASVAWKWRIRKINFRKNGGKLLKHSGVRIFTEAELAKATDNYDESKKLGEGGFGSVYKGRIAMDIEVAIKKPKDVHKPLMKKGFQDELKTVRQINHKNVVKLYGICLETRIPLLVYELILNDTRFNTLFKHIHPEVSPFLRSWENRLKIATEVALALKEMNSSKIIHGNIKSANILLDQSNSVKISDFGTSILIPPKHSHILATETEGALGYIDPEYLIIGELTIKSDVYSFGVILVELLTEKKPTKSVTNKSKEPINIIPHFISSMKDGTLSDVINFEAASEDEIKQVETVAKIAVKCLDQSSIKRPTMSEVAQQLAPINQSLTVEPNTEVVVEMDNSTEILMNVEASVHATPSCLSWLDSTSCF